MCRGCYEDAGSPWIDNPKVREAARLGAEVYSYNGAGGNCHVVLDDDNIDDANIQSCLDGARENTAGDPPEQIAAEVACMEAYLALSEGERWSALAVMWGYRGDEPGLIR